MPKNSSKQEAPADPKFPVELDLTTASSSAFYGALDKIAEWNESQPDPGPLGLNSGWHTVEPLTSLDFLRRNICNREPKLAPVRRYHYDMVNGQWHKTGQGLVFNVMGKMNEGQQRCLASYFGKVSFTTYIVTDVPDEPDLFAYYDDNAPRSEADTLHTSGLDSFSSPLAQAVHLAYRYENDVIGVFKQPKIHKLNKREVLDYARKHPSLSETGHILFPTYGKAVSIIDHKGVALVFAELVTAIHGARALDDFLVPLGSGANLEEGSAILGLRDRLATNDIEKERRLALLIKAFNFHILGKKLGRRGLFVADNEKFPRILPVSETVTETAE